jgi:hypothetical protein
VARQTALIVLRLTNCPAWSTFNQESRLVLRDFPQSGELDADSGQLLFIVTRDAEIVPRDSAITRPTTDANRS